MYNADVAQAAQDRNVRVALLAGFPPTEAAELVPLTDDNLSPWSDTEEDNDG